MSASLIIAGDMCLHGRTAALDVNQFSSLFEEVTPVIMSADVALVNLETAVLKSPVAPIKKAGPTIQTNERVVELIKKIGFRGVTLANNHFADCGNEGVQQSLSLLEKQSLWYFGAGMNAEEAAQVKLIQVGDKQVAIINACEHEFTIATSYKAGCNALNPLRIAQQIAQSKQTADYTIVIIHGGHEHYNLPSPRMQEMYRVFVDFGADAVINHHQHCYSGYEIYHCKPIVYGLGNFFFDWQGHGSDWNEGYMAKLTFDKEVKLELAPYIQNAETLGIRLMTEKENREFINKISDLNINIADTRLLEQRLTEWAKIKEDEYMRILLPRTGWAIRKLAKTKFGTCTINKYILPEYLTADRKLLLKSLFQCESHQEIMNLLLK